MSLPFIKTNSLYDYNKILAIHGIMMTISWFVLPVIGIYIARYLKSLGHTWFILHASLMSMTFLISLTSFVLIILYRYPPHFESDLLLNNAHTKIGLTVIIAMFFQIILGIIIHLLYNPERTIIPWYNKLHWYFGKLLVLLAMCNVIIGIYVYNTFDTNLYVGYYYGIYIVLGLIVLTFIISEFYHVKKYEDSSSSD